MASRRSITSIALRASSIAARPQRNAFTTCRGVQNILRQQYTVPVVLNTGLRRWYSALGGKSASESSLGEESASEQSSASSEESASEEEFVLESKIWEFEEIKNQVGNKTRGDRELVIVDVREPVELFQTGKIPGAINIPITSAVQSFHISPDDFEDVYGYERPSKDAELLFYCKAGIRARAAAGLAQHAGWKHVGEYPGSWLDWEANNGPVEEVKNQDKKGEES